LQSIVAEKFTTNINIYI